MEKPFEKIWIDLREFGWGIREVPVVWPEDKETLGPDTVGTEELKDNGVAYEDLSTEVQEKLNKPVDQEMVTEAVNEVAPGLVNSAVAEAVPAAVADKMDVVTEEQFNAIFYGDGESSDSSSSE